MGEIETPLKRGPNEPHSTQARILAEESSLDLLANHSRKTYRSAIVNLRSRLSECYEYVLRNKHNDHLCEEEKEKEIRKKRWSTPKHSVEDWVCRETELRIGDSTAALIAALAPTESYYCILEFSGVDLREETNPWRTHGEPNRYEELTIHVPLLDLVVATTRS